MAKRDIIVIGASAGGVEALTRLASELPSDLAAAVFVTLHFPRSSPSVLPRILGRAGPLPALHPVDGMPIRHGHIYVALPDFHLLVRPDVVRLVRGPTENGNRPAIDPMFRSAAVAYGPRVIGVVLTGNLDDGTGGLLAVRRRGGIGVAQDPVDAMFPSMPSSAIDHGAVDHIVPLEQLGPLLRRLTTEEIPLPTRKDIMDDAAREDAFSAFEVDAIEDPDRHPGQPSPFGCPDCGGVLWAIDDGELTRFRCRVGHGWTTEALRAQQSTSLETALWTALRALEESAALNRQMAERMRHRGADHVSARFTGNALQAEERARTIRELLLRQRVDTADEHEGAAVPLPVPAEPSA
ncbi:MAG TPA: chemotaxis protein CheB [Gemmatimonadaceae bacterium]